MRLFFQKSIYLSFEDNARVGCQFIILEFPPPPEERAPHQGSASLPDRGSIGGLFCGELAMYHPAGGGTYSDSFFVTACGTYEPPYCRTDTQSIFFH